ncbi:MAG: FtsX-like permease family protein [Balneola sp.]|nr:MAG: FtsX-like permease family protein [Balneola sp.]
MAAIIVGVAAQVAITSFRVNLNSSINEQAKELLGADLEVERNAEFQPELQAYLDSIAVDQSNSLAFSSMALFPKTGATRLSQITAMEDGFPYYGEIETVPPNAASTYLEEYGALVDQTILTQLELAPGDSIKVGFLTYEITGAIVEIPGQSTAASFFGPRVIIPLEGVENTGLLERGSRLEYEAYIKYKEGVDPEAVVKRLDVMNDVMDFRFDDIEERREEVGEAISLLSNFLNLIGFIALLLGGIGVASSIFVYIRQKINTVAVLRCVGASSNQTMMIYLIQAMFMGFIGALIGAVLGTVVQLYLPVLVQDFIPVDIELFISWGSVLTGVVTGVIISVIFALLPLVAVRKISPLFTLRSSEVNLSRLLGFGTKLLLSLIIGSSITGYAWFMLNDLVGALFFTGGFTICLLLLGGFAVLVMRVSRKFMPSGWSYEWRQGLANLYRPNNQTSTLLLTFGLGVTLISSLYLTQDMLLGTIDFEGEDELPNLALFDIQYDQNEGVNSIISDNGLEIMQNVPIVTMRLQSIQGNTLEEILADTSRQARRWALTREYRSTYRDSLVETETLESGEFIPRVPDFNAPVPISVEVGLMDDLAIELGDSIIWDVQGIPIESYVASIRTVNWQTPQPNFFVVFPAGVLEPAPQFFATTIRTTSREISVSLQQQIVQAYPNVSAIDVGQIVSTITDFLDRVTFVIQFIGLFSIITGLIVLAGSAATSRFQRIREGVLLRTLGAKQRQVVKIQIIEYALLGTIAAFLGLFLSVGASSLLSFFYFDIEFTPSFSILITEAIILVLLVLTIGMLNTRGIHQRPPLEILREEAA